MNHPFAWNSFDSAFVICILALATGFMAYFFISKSEKLKNYFSIKFGNNKSEVRWVLFERLIGVFFYGIVPALIIIIGFNKSLSDYGFSFENRLLSIYWILGLSPVLIAMNYFNCSKPDNLAMYPQIRASEWNIQLLILSALSWIAYLLAYEFMFRGYLLFISLEYLGVWPSIALNITIYALVHVPKGYKEAIGAIPLGIVLAIITIKTGNIWVAFVVHVVLALSNEWFSLKAHPDMKFIK
jgi:membrane protease YdiL (CAAX protease family)